jgi:hypothetical protein
MVDPAGALTRQAGMAAVGSTLLSNLRFRGRFIGLSNRSLLVVIGVNFLLSLGQYGKRGDNPNCEHESE